jgi:thioredoxin reductase
MSDVLVVGAGPAGLSAALTLGRVRRQVLLVDDGSPRNRPSPALHNFLTREGASPSEFLETARRELARYDSVEVVDGNVADIAEEEEEGRRFDVALDSGRRESLTKILLACGIEDELPVIDGLAPLWGTSVLHCPYCHGWEHRDRPLAVIGADARTVAQALHLAALSSETVVCTNGSPPFDDEAMSRLDAAGIGVRTEGIRTLRANEQGLQGIEFEDGTVAEAVAAFVGPSARPKNSLARLLGCALLDDGTVHVNQLGGTTVAGVFAAGDLARNPDVPFRGQMILAAASGVLAAMAIEEELLTGVTLTSSESTSSRTWRRRRGRNG